MTPDERAALVEKVAKALAVECAKSDDPPYKDRTWEDLATAAIDLIRAEVLEEAARAANVAWLDGVPVAEIPAAIRALKGNNDGR